MLQIGASLTYDTSSVNYDSNIFIIWTADYSPDGSRCTCPFIVCH